MTKIDEATVRACIEALDNNEQHYARDTLLALLPKPVDAAMQLVEDFAADTTDTGGSVVAPRNEWVLKHFARWLLDNLHLIQPRKEWSEEEIEAAARDGRIWGHSMQEDREACILSGIEMGRQLAPVDPVEPLTHDEIVKEAREWCARRFAGWGGAYRDGRIDNDQYMKLAIAILTAWKGEK